MPGTGAVPHPGHHLARLQQLPLTEVPPAGGLVLVVQGIDTIIQIFGYFVNVVINIEKYLKNLIKTCIIMRNNFMIVYRSLSRKIILSMISNFCHS